MEGVVDDDAEPIDVEFDDLPEKTKLDRVAGGDWWQTLLASERSFPVTVQKFATKFCHQLAQRFPLIAFHAVKAAPSHSVPKYYLVFGTRHIDGLVLMNDEMIKSRRVLAEMARPKGRLLFETRSEELVPDLDRLPELIVQLSPTHTTRKRITESLVRDSFGEYHTTEIRDAVANLLRSGRLVSKSGKTRINDDTEIWAVP